MTIQFNCVHCKKAIETPDDSAGKQCRCPDCGQVMPIPDPGIPIGQQFSGPSDYPQKPPAHPSNPYAAPPGPSMPPHPPTGSHYVASDRSGVVLGLGIASIAFSLSSCACCFIMFPITLGLGIPAWIMANNDLKEIELGERDPGQRGMLYAGRVCAIVGMAIGALLTVLNLGSMFLQIGLQGFGR